MVTIQRALLLFAVTLGGVAIAPTLQADSAIATLELVRGDTVVWRFNTTPDTSFSVRGRLQWCIDSTQSEGDPYQFVVIDGEASAGGWYPHGSYLGAFDDMVVAGAAGRRMPPHLPQRWEDCTSGGDFGAGYYRVNDSYTFVYVEGHVKSWLNISEITLRRGEILSQDVQVSRGRIVLQSEAEEGAYASTPVAGGGFVVHEHWNATHDAIALWMSGAGDGKQVADASRCERNGESCGPLSPGTLLRGKGQQSWHFWRDYEVRTAREDPWLVLVELPGDDYLAG